MYSLLLTTISYYPKTQMSRVNKMILEIMVEKFDMFDIMFSATFKMTGRRAKERCA